MNLTNRAEIFARAAHSAVRQTRKFSGGKVPYIVHPMRVADLVSEGRGTVEMQAAAWLHDVVEDTGVTLTVITAEFGNTVARYVDYMTERKEYFDTKEARKLATVEKMKNAPVEVKIIKTCDIIANAEDLYFNYDRVYAEDPEFPYRWINEQRRLFGVLCQDDIPKLLFARANALLYGNFYENKMVSSYSDSTHLLQTDFL